MNVKRVWRIVFTAMLFTMLLFACSKDEPAKVSNQTDMKSESQVTQIPTKEAQESKTEGTNQESKPTDIVTQQPVGQMKDDTAKEGETIKKEICDISSIDLVKEIKIGWNLGNTMDATGGSGISSETSW
ncbi:MAG TPA: hypothetical protein VN131_01360, partial [Mobilitalea sp.]|nr:hypothetical protein [Mobilitalea sp.]